MSDATVLVIGAGGQIGTELVEALRAKHGANNVIASDLKACSSESLQRGPCEQLDATDGDAIRAVIEKYGVNQVYQLAAMLSATAEKHPIKAWDLNMDGLLLILEMAREGLIEKVFWPSSIGVFGPTTPADSTPQNTVTEPTTVYGISKLAGERWCAYYHEKFGVDVRCIRYPGLISFKAPPGGGTTDYAIDIFHKALDTGEYTCFLEHDMMLPMMHMDDAIRGTLELMEAPAEKLSTRSGYNFAGLSFTPAQLAEEIKKSTPDFKISYEPDFRQQIAASWPNSIDDSTARNDWNWVPEYDLTKLVNNMLTNLQ